MPAFVGNKQVEAYEWITNRDLVDSAHLLMGGIDLDPASSEMANTYVNLIDGKQLEVCRLR
jgi:hypothetical protein